MRILDQTLKCACCGKESEQKILVSFTSGGGRDLDYRPTGMGAFVYEHVLQICPECFYVASDISEAVKENIEATSKQYYKDAIKEIGTLGIDFSVGKFYLMGLINEGAGEPLKATDNYIYSYWMVDRMSNSSTENSSVDYKKIARKFLIRAVNIRKHHYNKLDKIQVLQTLDLMRKLNDFESVISECRSILRAKQVHGEALTDTERKQVIFEKMVSKKGDNANYSTFDVAMEIEDDYIDEDEK